MQNFSNLSSSSTVPPIRYNYASGNPLIDGVLYHSSWDVDTIYYSFPDEGMDYDEDPNMDGIQTFSDLPKYYFEPLGDQEKDVFIKLFDQLNNYSQANYERLDSPEEGSAIIRIGSQNDTPDGSPWALLPDTEGPENGDIWLNSNFGNESAINIGSKESYLAMRMIAFASGLFPGHLENWRGALPYEFDSLEFSITTNRSYIGADIKQHSVEVGGYPQSFMISDIAAIQYLYGANFNYQSDDSVYQWNEQTGEMSINGVAQGLPEINRIFLTIWDGGGNDTFDLSNYTLDLNVSLIPGRGSTFDADQLSRLGPNVVASANVYNALLYQGDRNSLIENVVGGKGNDQIVGNIADNYLWGRSGNDLMRGAGGEDTLVGGLGKDRLFGGANNDELNGGAGADRIFGGWGADTINGGRGRDIIRGGIGDDQIDGGAGNDILIGGNGNDTFIFAGERGIDNIVDFKVGGDKIDVSWYGIEYDDMLFINEADGTHIYVGDEQIAILSGVSFDTLDETDFIF